MALEDLTGTKYIDDLVATNPAAGDNVSEGDDHIRGIKNVLKTTFPSIDGAITATDTELNYVDGVTSAIQTQIDTKIATTDSASNDFVTYTQLNANLNTTTANVAAVETRRAANVAGAVSIKHLGRLINTNVAVNCVYSGQLKKEIEANN